MNLFVYGTLLVPAILEAITGKDDLDSVPATLEKHEIRRVKGGDFPVVFAGAGIVPGRVLFDVPNSTMRRLDAYEDSFYRRERVEVTTDSGLVESFAYIVPAEVAARVASDERWTLGWFEREAFDRYWERLFQ